MIKYKSMKELDTQEKYDEYCDTLRKETKQLVYDNIRDEWFIKGILIGIIIGTICTSILMIKV